MTYAPVSICIGQGQILQGLDASLEGLEVGKESEITIPPERAFGRKDGKLMKLVPTSVFRKQNINPVPGLQLNIDGAVGTVRTVTGGRTIVDFNHPFAGREVIYKVLIRRKLTDDREKVLALVELALNQKRDAVKIDIRECKAYIEVKQEFPEDLLKIVKERITQLLPQITDVEFKMDGPAAQKPVPEAEHKNVPPGNNADSPARGYH
jgi:FKBP-type peptidyl-prolyl cis-trans isomerase SlyD